MLRHQALCVLSTWVLIQTGVDAVLASTRLVQGTLLVAATANDLAGNEGITLVARNTLAHGAMLRGVALSKPAAWVLDQARVDTVAVDACLLVPALVVSLAARKLAGNLWVANVARRTDTDWPVILDEARGSRATVARIHTLSVDTSRSVGTVIISGAAGRVGQLHWLALGVGVGQPALPAGTHHSPEGQAVHHRADCCDIARGQGQAWVLASLVEAGGVVRTVSVHIALRLRLRHHR